MRPLNFLLSLLALAGYGLAGSDKCGFFEQGFSSTGVDPTEFLAVLAKITLMSRRMRVEALRADERTASYTLDKIIGDVSIESHTLVNYTPRLEDTEPFPCAADRLAIASTFAKWQTTTGAFLVALYKSAETLQQGARHHTSRLAYELANFRNATADFCRIFLVVISTNDLAPTDGRAMAQAVMAMDSIFEDTIRKLRQKDSFRG